MENLCSQKTMLRKLKASHGLGENMCKSVSDKVLTFRIFKELNNKITNNPYKQWTKDMDRYFNKEDIQRTSKDTKR